MKDNELKPAKGAIKKRKRRGRGNASGLGGEAGRGHKGQRSRSGFSARSGFEGGQTPLYRRIPKRRGLGNLATGPETVAINLSILEQYFESNDTVERETLIKKGLIKKTEQFKILGNGSLTKKLTLKGCVISKPALEKLEKASCVVEMGG